MKQKLYALDAFFIEKLKLSENDPIMLVTMRDAYCKLFILTRTVNDKVEFIIIYKKVQLPSSVRLHIYVPSHI